MDGIRWIICLEIITEKVLRLLLLFRLSAIPECLKKFIYIQEYLPLVKDTNNRFYIAVQIYIRYLFGDSWRKVLFEKRLSALAVLDR